MNLVKKHRGMPAIPNSCVTVQSLGEQELSSHDTCSRGHWKVTHLCSEMLSEPVSFLEVPRIHFTFSVSAGMFGLLVQIGQSVPSLLQKPVQFPANKPRKRRNVLTSFYCNLNQIWTGAVQKTEKQLMQGTKSQDIKKKIFSMQIKL